MRKVFSILAVFLLASAANAADLTGDVELQFAQGANDDWGGTLDVDVDVTGNAGAVALGFGATEGGNVSLDTWTVGTEVNTIGLAMGNDNDAFVNAEGEHTISQPALTESLMVSMGSAKVALGFTDWNTDVTDLSSIQGSYTMDMTGISVTAAGDLNLDTDNIILGAEVGNVPVGALALGGTATYDTDAEMFAYEGVIGMSGITGYMNGDQDDALQNVGGEYVYNLGGANLTGGMNYNIDNEDWTPSVTVGFSF